MGSRSALQGSLLRRLCLFEPRYHINAPDQICDCMKDSRACARGYDECDSPARKQAAPPAKIAGLNRMCAPGNCPDSGPYCCYRSRIENTGPCGRAQGRRTLLSHHPVFSGQPPQNRRQPDVGGSETQSRSPRPDRTICAKPRAVLRASHKTRSRSCRLAAAGTRDWPGQW
jgi:hypothetical protein